MKRKMEKEMNMKREKETEKEMKKKMELKMVKKEDKEMEKEMKTEKEMEMCIIETKLSLMNTQTVAVLVSDCYTHLIVLYLFI